MPAPTRPTLTLRVCFMRTTNSAWLREDVMFMEVLAVARTLSPSTRH